MVSGSKIISQYTKEGCSLKQVDSELQRSVFHADLPPLSDTFFLDTIIEFSP